ncbi:MAG: DUF115 domain-containing protein [Thaumarchaeota archaeon]|nr:DUF115 domain-containing protein [Nitrososphaerota archaeon]
MANESAPQLGNLWHDKFYALIRDSLGLDGAKDISSRDLLWNLLHLQNDSDLLEEVENSIKGRNVVVFGAGPSLESDLTGLLSFLREKKPTIVSSDGAAEALLVRDVDSRIIVSDLDSCSEGTLKKYSESETVFAHAHGDNIELIKKIVPRLGRKTLGTTQVASRLPIRNFGGFTDGDRACYVTCNFDPSSVIIAGMDFGRVEGSYSVNRYSDSPNPKRQTKLLWGKKSLEYLISIYPETKFYNVTKFGLQIEGTVRASYDRFS